MPEPRVALFDIETAPTRGWVWTNYEANLISTDKDWYMLSFAVQWLGERKIRTYALPDFAGYRSNKECDRALVKELWKVFDAADILVGHNSMAFDVKKANARFLVNGLRPPSPYKQIDTLKIARSRFKFGSNKLNDLGVALGVGKKLPHTGAHLWFSCMAGDPKSWALMKRYNARDVELLAAVYEKLKPWAVNHPNMNLYEDGDDCPTCQSDNIQSRGTHVKLNSKCRRFHCQDCGAWWSGAKV